MAGTQKGRLTTSTQHDVPISDGAAGPRRIVASQVHFPPNTAQGVVQDLSSDEDNEEGEVKAKKAEEPSQVGHIVMIMARHPRIGLVAAAVALISFAAVTGVLTKGWLVPTLGILCFAPVAVVLAGYIALAIEHERKQPQPAGIDTTMLVGILERVCSGMDNANAQLENLLKLIDHSSAGLGPQVIKVDLKKPSGEEIFLVAIAGKPLRSPQLFRVYHIDEAEIDTYEDTLYRIEKLLPGDFQDPDVWESGYSIIEAVVSMTRPMSTM